VIKTIAVHPKKREIVYIGAAAGGIWKSTNGGMMEPIFEI